MPLPLDAVLAGAVSRRAEGTSVLLPIAERLTIGLAPRVLAARTPAVVPARAPARPTLQRMVRVNANPPIDIRTPTEVRDLLERNGVHYYFKYTQAIEMTGEIDNATLAMTFNDEPAAVDWILAQLREYDILWEDVQLKKLESGAQELIQRKLVEICELLRRKQETDVQLDLTTVPTTSGKAFTDPTTRWYKAVVKNGLCGGWASLHRHRPEWFEALWQAVEAWEPTEGRSTDEAVNDLEKHVRSKVSKDLTEDPLNDVVSVLTSAYEIMDVLEPKEKYGSAPDMFPKLDPLVTRRPIHRRKFHVTYASAGNKIYDEIATKVKRKPGGYTAHLESDVHHASIRVSVSKSGLKGKWHILESEVAGVLVSDDTRTIQHALRDTVYFAGPDDKTQEVDLTIYATPVR